MDKTEDLARAKLIQHMRRAARIQRAELLLKLLRTLIGRDRQQPACARAAQAVAGSGR